MSKDKKLEEILTRHVHKDAVPYLVDVWKELPFSFTVTPPRKSCYGNYTYRNQHHHIRLNSNLSTTHFLLTYLHEVAHQRVYEQAFKTRKKVLPHGNEWKTMFKKLMIPVLNEQIIPSYIFPILVQHLQNPPASSGRDALLQKAFRRESGDIDLIDKLFFALEDVQVGTVFKLKNRLFKKIGTKRTRALCEEIPTQEKYLISLRAEVDVIQN
ncbi:MAG: SprT-like domain-containing protein [Spirosomataceae bacterium]